MASRLNMVGIIVSIGAVAACTPKPLPIPPPPPVVIVPVLPGRAVAKQPFLIRQAARSDGFFPINDHLNKSE